MIAESHSIFVRSISSEVRRQFTTALHRRHDFAESFNIFSFRFIGSEKRIHNNLAPPSP
jgi:hypothetical protein